MPRVALIFAEEGGFRNGGAFSQRRPLFAAAKIFAEGCVRLRNYFAMEGYFRSQPLISQRAPKACEIISQEMAIFTGAYFGL